MSSTAHRLLAGVASALLLAAPLATPGWAQDADIEAPAETAAPNGGEMDDDPTVATINGDPIRLSEVIRAIDAMPEQYRQLPVEMLIPVMAEQVGLARLVAQQAEAAGLRDDPEVVARVEQTTASILQQVWLEREILSRITDEAVEEAYDAFVAANPPTEQILARHILVESEEEATEIIERLDAGEAFEDLADEHTIDPSGRGRGGELGWFGRGQMVPSFEEAAFAVEPGSYGATPVETQFGWHVIQVEDSRDVPPPSLEEMRPQIEGQMGQEILSEILEGLQASAEIVMIGPDGQPIPDPEIGPGILPEDLPTELPDTLTDPAP